MVNGEFFIDWETKSSETPLDTRDPFNRIALSGPPKFDLCSLLSQCDSRSDQRIRGRTRWLPNFGNHSQSMQIDLIQYCSDHRDYARRIGMVKGLATDRFIGHPIDIWNSRTYIDESQRTTDGIPWGMSLERDCINRSLIKVVEQHAQSSPWSDRNEYSNCIGPYMKLYNVINPAHTNYAGSENNCRQAYIVLRRD